MADTKAKEAGVDKLDLTATKIGLKFQIEKRKESIDFFLTEAEKLKIAQSK
jgi:hypothetical protein